MCDFYYAPGTWKLNHLQSIGIWSDTQFVPTASPPCRSVQMLAQALGVTLNLKELNLREKQEHLTPEFLKINPQHTIPTLVDNDFSIWESRAILGYLVEKYGKNDSFFPKDPKARAVVNQRLYFDMGTLYQRFYEFFVPQFMHGQPADPEKLKKIHEALSFLEGFLAKTKYVAADKPTIADYALIASITTLEVAQIDFSAYPNINRWSELCKTSLPGIEANEAGLAAMKQMAQRHAHAKAQ